MDFPKDIDPGMRLLLTLMAIASVTKNRAEAEAIERVEPPTKPKTELRAETEAIIKVPGTPLPPENVGKAFQPGIDEIKNLLAYIPHLKNGKKVRFSFTTSHTNSAGTKTETFNYQFTHTA